MRAVVMSGQTGDAHPAAEKIIVMMLLSVRGVLPCSKIGCK